MHADISFCRLLWVWESVEPPAVLTVLPPTPLCVITSRRSIAGAAGNSLDYHGKTCQNFSFNSLLNAQVLCNRPCAGSGDFFQQKFEYLHIYNLWRLSIVVTQILKVCLKEAIRISYTVKNPYFFLNFTENGAIVLPAHFFRCIYLWAC